MIYISPRNEYPRHIGDIQIEHPDFKEGNSLPDGWVKVETAEMPIAGLDEIVYEDFPVEVGGAMIQNWKVRSMTSAEIDRRDAGKTAKAKLKAMGLSEEEIKALLGQ